MITTRRAGAEDIPVLVGLMRAFYAESGFSLDDAWAAASFATLLGDDSKGTAWIVTQNDQPAGYIVLTLRHSMEYGGPDGFIDDLYVRPDCRRQGLGRAAIETLLAESARRNVRALHVEAGHRNEAAQALYKSFGLDRLQDGRQLLTLCLSASKGHQKLPT